MASRVTAIHKRKREEDVENTRTAHHSNATSDNSSSYLRGASAGATTVTAAVLTACRAALVKSPASSRALLAKHRASITPVLARILEIVGGYRIEDGRTPLHESVKRGDAATAQSLIEAGADIGAKDKNGATPLDIATDDECCDLLENHQFALAILDEDPDALIAAVVAHCADLSGFRDSVPAASLSWRAYHFDPHFHWAPLEYCEAIFDWARDAFIAQTAFSIQPFAELPDDCAGDIVDYLETRLARTEMLQIAKYCTSAESCSWVCRVIAAGVAADIAAEASINLLRGIRNEDAAAVQDCIAKGANVEANIGSGITAFRLVSRTGDADIAKLLLEAGADTEGKTVVGDTAIINAARWGNADIVMHLLEAGADKDVQEDDGTTALMRASSCGSAATVEILLEAGADMNMKNTFDGYTALITASMNGHIDIVELLIEAGADLNVEDNEGYTALMRALVGYQAEVVDRLVEARANVDVHENSELGYTALLWAAQEGHSYLAEYFLAAGANKEAENHSGYSAIMLAANEGHTDIVESLLAVGADVDNENPDGATSLMLASSKGYDQIVNLLLEAGADKDMKDNDDKMALEWAIENGHDECAELLE